MHVCSFYPMYRDLSEMQKNIQGTSSDLMEVIIFSGKWKVM